MKYFSKNILGVVLGLTFVIAGVMSVGSLAIAQEDSTDQLEEVVVTGSRITRANYVSSSPVTQVDAEEFIFQGTVRVEDLMRNIPQVWSNQNTGQSNGATGTATVNLRNLGDERTLVLVNGRRLPAGSPISGGFGADINQIPGSLIKRVEVLTGGASAIYGSDAVSGVVNFLMDDEFEGVKLDYQVSTYQHDNDNSKWRGIVESNGYPVPTGSNTGGDMSALSLVIGGNFDSGRGNATVYASWRQIDPLAQSERDYSACALSDEADDCFGSSTIPDGAVRDFGGLQSYVNNWETLNNNIGYVPDEGEDAVDTSVKKFLFEADGKTTLKDDDDNPIRNSAYNHAVTVPGIDLKVAGDQVVPRAGTTFNYGPLNYFQRPDERFTFGGFAHYEVNDHLDIYAETMFMDDRSISQIAPSGAFYVTETLNCDNALFSAQQREEICGKYLDNADLIAQLNEIREAIDVDTDADAYDPSTSNAHLLAFDLAPHPLLDDNPLAAVNIGRRNVEGGNRRQDLRHTSLRIVLGARGDVNDVWRYDAFYQHSEVSMENTYQNDLSVTRLTRALDVVADAEGNPVCRTALPGGADTACVPWDLFTTGNVSPEALEYIVLPLFARGTTNQTVISGYLAADLGDYGVRFPSAENSVNVVFGFEYRDENMDFSPDVGFQIGDGAGQGGATQGVGGGYSVSEFFTEVNLPLIEGRPGAESLMVDLSYRRSKYDYGISTDTYGARSSWDINSQVRFRGSYQRAVRGAHVREFFLPQGFNLFDITGDPCGGEVTDGETAAGRTLEECMRSGVTAAQFGNIANNPAGQYNFLQGGNPDLEPEVSDSYSFGTVLAPDFVPGLVLSVDYFQIEIEEGIDSLSPEFVLDECLDGDLAQCAKVKRSGAGDLWVGSNVDRSGHVVTLQDNLAIEVVEGVDVSIEYTLDIGNLGDISFTDVMSVINTWDQQELAGAPTVDCKGIWGGVCGYPTPDFQNNLRITWNTPWEFTASLLWRHIDSVEDAKGNVDLDAINYFDLTAIWNVHENISLRAGMTNILDEEPPVGGNGAGPSNNGNGNVFPGMYDALGRYMFAGASLSF